MKPCDGSGARVPYYDVSYTTTICPGCGQRKAVVDDRDGSVFSVAEHYGIGSIDWAPPPDVIALQEENGRLINAGYSCESPERKALEERMIELMGIRNEPPLTVEERQLLAPYLKKKAQ